MSKKKHLSAPVTKPSVEKKEKTGVGSSGLMRLILTILVVVIYGSSVNYEFTMDDDLFYQKHKSVQMGLSGFKEFFAYGSMNKFDGTTGLQPYRPVTLLAFAFEKDLFDNSPAAAHFVNILVYLIMVQLLFSLLARLFPLVNPWLRLLMVLFFVAHPTHTEVVASVKSLDELLAGAFALGAWMMFVPRNKGSQTSVLMMLLGVLLFFMALLSKESAISFLVIIPLCSYMLLRKGLRASALELMPLAVVTGVFLWMRNSAIGGEPTSAPMTILDNVIMSAQGWAEILATKMKVLFYYLRIYTIPWPLSYDYSYNQVPVTGWAAAEPILGLVLYAALSVLAVLNFKKWPELSFLILYFFITSSPTNNLFFLNGATVAERFLFLPSVLYGVAVVLLGSKLFRVDASGFDGKNKPVFSGVLAVWLLLFSGASFSRAAVWESNITLFESGILSAPNSSRTHYNLASECMTQARKVETAEEKSALANRALGEFDKSLEIYPKNIQANYNKSICYTLMADTARAMEQYKKTIRLDSRNKESMVNLGILFQGKGMLDSARGYYEMAYKISPGERIIRKNLEDVYFFKGIEHNRKGENDLAINCFYQSLIFNPRNTFTLNNIAIVHSANKQYDSARIYVQRALDTDPGSVMVMENVARIGYLSKDYNTAIDYASRVLRANPRMKKSAGILADTYRAMGNVAESNKYQQLFNSLP
jgi:tetratricopeptide (TPR) repeat protein